MKNPRPPKCQHNAVAYLVTWVSEMSDGQFRNVVAFLAGISFGIALALIVAVCLVGLDK